VVTDEFCAQAGKGLVAGPAKLEVGWLGSSTRVGGLRDITLQ
jgi:hypothetical protein